MLIIMAGLPGTGKSTVAIELARRMDAVILSKDTLRHALFPPDLVEYSREQDDFVIGLLLSTAQFIWRRHPGKTVILDGRTFSRTSQRQCVIQFAERESQTWHLVECVCADEVARARLSQPDPGHPAGNRTSALYDEVKAQWEPIAEKHITIRTDQPIAFDHVAYELIS